MSANVYPIWQPGDAVDTAEQFALEGKPMIEMWAEVGIWNAGEPALVVMRGEYWGGQLVDTPSVLHDVPLSIPDGFDDKQDVAQLEWEEPLRGLGYRRVPGSAGEYTECGYLFPIEQL